jgi:hypothetical protein
MKGLAKQSETHYLAHPLTFTFLFSAARVTTKRNPDGDEQQCHPVRGAES